MERLLGRLVFRNNIIHTTKHLRYFLFTNQTKSISHLKILKPNSNRVLIQRRYESFGNDKQAKLKQNFVRLF